MAQNNGYEILNRVGRRVDQRIWKSRSKAQRAIRAIIKNNSQEQREMTGYVGLKVRAFKLNDREKTEISKAKDFVRD